MHTGSIRHGGGALEDIVSLTPIGEPRHKITVASLREKKVHHEPITCLTAYDYASARLVDEAAIDIVLVGDSLAMTMLGYENTLTVTVDEMLHHAKAVRRGVKNAFLVVDMPYGSYHLGADEAVRNASRFIKEAGAEAVKIEGDIKAAIPPVITPIQRCGPRLTRESTSIEAASGSDQHRLPAGLPGREARAILSSHRK